MDLSPNYKTNWNLIKKPVIMFAVLIFIGIPVTQIFGLESLFTNKLLNYGLGHSNVLHQMLGGYTALGLFLVLALLAYLSSKVLLKFIESISDPKLNYDDVVGIKYMDIPPIPDVEAVMSYRERSDMAYAKGLGRLDPQLLKQYGIKE